MLNEGWCRLNHFNETGPTVFGTVLGPTPSTRSVPPVASAGSVPARRGPPSTLVCLAQGAFPPPNSTCFRPGHPPVLESMVQMRSVVVPVEGSATAETRGPSPTDVVPGRVPGGPVCGVPAVDPTGSFYEVPTPIPSLPKYLQSCHSGAPTRPPSAPTPALPCARTREEPPCLCPNTPADEGGVTWAGERIRPGAPHATPDLGAGRTLVPGPYRPVCPYRRVGTVSSLSWFFPGSRWG